MASHRSLERDILACRRCPRLTAALAEYRAAHPESHSAPVPAAGTAAARLLIIGLAPGRKGANQTGRVFVGDFSGRFLHESLHRLGLASSPDPFQAALHGVRMTNVVKCWPPGNKPGTEEISNCRPLLDRELELFWRPRVRAPRSILCLGRIAHEVALRQIAQRLPDTALLPDFGHARSTWLASNLKWTTSYHPSLQNVNTGRLDAPMLDAALAQWADLQAP
ncbi:MAG: uracil-DNA glycosylase family protein [Pseudomonadales bacterium]